GEQEGAPRLLGEPLEQRTEGAAGRAPGGPEVDHHGPPEALLDDIRLETGIRCVDDGAIAHAASFVICPDGSGHDASRRRPRRPRFLGRPPPPRGAIRAGRAGIDRADLPGRLEGAGRGAAAPPLPRTGAPAPRSRIARSLPRGGYRGSGAH